MKSVKKYYAILLVMAALASLAFQGTASAHVLLVDHQANIAAVLHINPDDDPVAGQPSQLFFDVQDANSDARIPYGAYQLIISDESNNQTFAVTHAYGSTVSAEYTFPTQGLYRLTLRSNPAYNSLQKVALETSLRIGRGVGFNPDQPRYEWATDGLIVAGVLMVLLGIAAWNNRAAILARSKF